jgi:uncharacterized protein (DUF2336 family)
MSEMNSSYSDQKLVVDHSPVDELIGTLEGDSLRERQKIVDRITDLFLAGSRGYSREQIALFDDVLQQLSADIEVGARARLARRLANARNAPPRLVRLLAFDDEISVAAELLAHSEGLTDGDLAENARTKSQKHLLAIAQRLKLSESVTDVLVERGNREVVHKVASNRGARFSLAGYERLTMRARRDRRLTLALSERNDVPRQCFLRLLECASAAVRAKLEAANPAAAEAVRRSVDDVATVMQNEARLVSQEHKAAARKARRFRMNPVTEANVHASARAQRFEKAVIALAKLGCFPVEVVERALLDKGDDMILILARAADCSWLTVKELLQMQVAGRRMTPDDLSHAYGRYKKFSPQTARNILGFHRQRMQSEVEQATSVSDARQAAGLKRGSISAPVVSRHYAMAGISLYKS